MAIGNIMVIIELDILYITFIIAIRVCMYQTLNYIRTRYAYGSCFSKSFLPPLIKKKKIPIFIIK